VPALPSKDPARSPKDRNPEPIFHTPLTLPRIRGFIVVRTSAGDIAWEAEVTACRWPIREPEKCEGTVAVQGEQPVTMKICK
jgi:hypothetical protein